MRRAPANELPSKYPTTLVHWLVCAYSQTPNNGNYQENRAALFNSKHRINRGVRFHFLGVEHQLGWRWRGRCWHKASLFQRPSPKNMNGPHLKDARHLPQFKLKTLTATIRCLYSMSLLCPAQSRTRIRELIWNSPVADDHGEPALGEVV